MKSLWSPVCTRLTVWVVGAAVLAGIGGGLARNWAPGDSLANVRKYDRYLRQATRRHLPAEWDWRLLKAMIAQESRFRPRVVSPAGAVGLSQMLPATAAELGVGSMELRRPEISIDVGARYLRQLYDGWAEIPAGPPHYTRARFAVASYNAGPRRVREAWSEAGRPRRWNVLAPRLPTETQVHIRRVFDEYFPAFRQSGPGTAKPWQRQDRTPPWQQRS